MMYLVRYREWDNYNTWSDLQVTLFETQEALTLFLLQHYYSAQYHIWWDAKRNIPISFRVQPLPLDWQDFTGCCAAGLTIKAISIGMFLWVDSSERDLEKFLKTSPETTKKAMYYENLATPRFEEQKKARLKLYQELKAEFE